MSDDKALYGRISARRVGMIYDVLAEHIVPKSDLDFADPFQLLVAVVLSAQATDKSVNLACAELFPVAGTPDALAQLGAEGIKPYIKRVGLANTKAKNVAKLSAIIRDHYHSQVPDDREALENLPGVGRKTANVVLNIVFGHPTIAVDTHVHRVANRLGIAQTNNVDQTERVLLARTPKRHGVHAHHYLILHGRYCCTARNPKCGACPVARHCPSVGNV